MDAKYIAAAVPVFILAMALELFISWRRRQPVYRFEDAVANLGCGIGQQIIGVFFGVLPIFIYTLLYEKLRIFTVSPRSPLGWIAAIVLLDFCYYLYHRASHRVNFLWAGHAIHHQSEEYNLSVALRQSWTQQMASWVFYLPLAVLGFPPLMYVLAATFDTLYQFWIHTRLVGRLGRLEWLFNTPSHHRVHHGIDPKYIDRNYAGIFIIWDRLLGTFLPEEGEPVYGTVKPLSSWNAVWANLEPLVHLYRMSRRTRRLRDKLLVWVMPPEWRPADLGGPVVIPDVTRETQRKYALPASRRLLPYLAVNFALVLLAATGFLLLQGHAGMPLLLALAGLILLSLLCIGGLIEGRAWAGPVEALRIALIIGLGLAVLRQPSLGQRTSSQSGTWSEAVTVRSTPEPPLSRPRT